MNWRSPMVLMLFASLAYPSHGQESLTDEFKGMSAKQRSQVAKQELEAAAKDVNFQALMQKADSLARERDLEASLAAYREARQLRPYNVQPKVRIQDLEDLIARATVESMPADVQEDPTVPPLVSPEATAPVPVKGSQEQEVTRDPGPSVPVQAAPRSAPRPVPVTSATTTTPVEPEPALENGMHERTFREGQAIVIERTLVIDGNATFYRKVKHPWGAIYYFRNGEPISERMWMDSSKALDSTP